MLYIWAGSVVTVYCFVGVGIVILTARRQTCCGSSISTDTHVLFRVCLKRLSLSCGGTRCVSNDTHSNSNSSQDHFYETSCATGKRTVVICVQVSAVKQSQLLHRCSWMYDGRHDGFSWSDKVDPLSPLPWGKET